MNITELAALAGVSKAAVSRYFNNGYLSPEKRAAIEAAVQQTGYVPSERARGLRSRKTHQVGVVLPRLSSESSARVVEGVGRVLDAAGYQLLLVNTENTPQKEVEALDYFRHNRVDGVIFLASIFTPAHRAVLQSMQVPVVIVGQQYPGLPCVHHNDRGAAEALTALMLQKGCRRPAYLGVTTADEAAGLARREGYAAALKAAGLPLQAQYMRISPFTMEGGFAAAEALLTTTPRPDGLFCATDQIALGVLQYCREQGIAVPGDLLVAAVGDTTAGRMAYTPLTSAHLHYHTSGQQAARLLLDCIHGDAVRRNICLEYELAERESTKRRAPKTETT